MDDDVMDDQQRVSTLELFFDLVFVFTITQLTSVLVLHPNLRGLAQVALMLGVIWWMYSGYAWLTNAVPPDRPERQAFLLAAMGAYLVLALSIPHAFTGTGLTFGLAYFAIVLIHAGLFARSTEATVVQAVTGLAKFNVSSAALLVVGGALGGTAEYVLWTAAFLLEWITPPLTGISDFRIQAAHFVERHGLVVIVAIGESVVAIGIGAAGLPVNAELVLVAVLGLMLSACLWWSYFAGEESRAERALAAAPRLRQPWLAVYAYGYWHLPILLGIIAIAFALKKSTGHAFDELDLAPALGLGGGVAAFLLGDVLFRRTLGLGTGPHRAAAGVLALATIPLGLAASAFLQLAALVALFAGALLLERQASSSRYRPIVSPA
ncbi:MAG: low temperature requirement protein A, partial [Thermoleophilaceae bacterium]